MQVTPAEINCEAFSFKGEGGAIIRGLKWLPPEDKIKAVLIINHGMAEHIARYDGFARVLCEKGFAVYGEDHRGHGLTAGSPEKYGYFANSRGWIHVISDIRSLYLSIMEERKGLPVCMLGHSMGSFLTRHYLSLYGSELQAAVIMGTGSHSAMKVFLGKVLAGLEIRFKGKKHASKMLDYLSFGTFNKPYKAPDSTGFEWLSRDEDEVRKYLDDPACGFICTSSFFSDLFTGMDVIRKEECYRSTPNDLPLLVVSGEDDPVGGPRGKGVESVARKYKRNGNGNLTLMLKKGMRHECLNEIGREKLISDITDWLTACTAG